MANDSGLIAVLAQWVADTLKALTYNNVLVFKTADIWKHQVSASASGIEASSRYSPFAFVGKGDEDTAREGDNDLRRVPDIRILIGVDSKEDGVATWGDATHLGISKIIDLVIAALDSKRPDDIEIDCDEIYYDDGLEIVDMPKTQWYQLNFSFSRMET